ncbi:MAG: hypothetical protein OXP70_11960 [Acidobacteriota bacterium]|nr:hypothetical protein [Acidobacteriota bacterium]
MSTTSHPNDSSARLRSRMAADRRQFEEAAASELRRFGESLRAVVKDELRSIEAITAAGTARTRVILLNAWLRPLVVGLVIFVGISGGSWGLMRWLSAGIQRRIETRARLDVQIEDARATLAEIEETTWGVTLVETERGRFVVLPDGTLEHPPWTVGGRPALKLPSE